MTQKKLLYYPLNRNGEEKWLYAEGLDDMKVVGAYVVKLYHSMINIDFPVEACGDNHYIIGILLVTDNGTEEPMQRRRVIGQTLFLSQCGGATHLYSRFLAFSNSGDSWSGWDFVNKKHCEEIVNKVTTDIAKLDVETIRELVCRIDASRATLRAELFDAMYDIDFQGTEPVECAPVKILNGYYTIGNSYIANDEFVTNIFELKNDVLYNLSSYTFGANIANIILYDDSLKPLMSLRETKVNTNIRKRTASYIGLSSSITGTTGLLYAYSKMYLSKDRFAVGCIRNENISLQSVEPRQTTFFISKNLFNKNDKNVIIGGYDIGTGVQNSASLNFSGWIPVEPGETYVFSQYGETRIARFVTFYNQSFEFVSYISGAETITISENVKYVRLTVQTAYWDTFQMELGVEATAYEEYKPLIKEEYLPDTSDFKLENDCKNLADPNKITKGKYYIDFTTGDVCDGFGGGYTDYIPITKSGLAITGGYYGGTVIGYAVYDVNKKYIRGAKGDFVNYQDGDAYVRFTIKADVEVMVNQGIIPLDYTPYVEDVVVASLPRRLRTQLNISLPNKIYAVVGDTLQLFYRGIIQAVNPYNYNILVSCSKGKQYPRYFEYTPTLSDLGTVDFKIQISDDNGNVISSNACKLVTVDAVKSPDTDLKVMCFGDSLTSAGIWCREADRRLTETGGAPNGNGLTNISFVGAKENETTGYFGVGGWTWESYTTAGSPAIRFNVSGVSSLVVGATYANNGYIYTIREINVTEGTGNILCAVDKATYLPQDSGTLTKTSGGGDASIKFTSYSVDSQNPLWDGCKMTFVPYASKVSNGLIDVVYTLLSWNGQTPWRTDFTSIIEQIKVFANTLHSEFPDAKLKIMGVQIPSVTGGMGANYGATGTSYADGYGMVVTALNMNKAYQDFANSEGYSSFVEFVNISSQFDSENNMPQEDAPVNTRSSVTEKRGTNGVHPANEGYLQIADVVYRNFIANFCQ